MSEWLAFRTTATGKAFTTAVSAFKAAIPSTSRRWDSEHAYWLFDPKFAEVVSAMADSDIGPAISLDEDDRQHNRRPVSDDEQLDTVLIDSITQVEEE